MTKEDLKKTLEEKGIKEGDPIRCPRFQATVHKGWKWEDVIRLKTKSLTRDWVIFFKRSGKFDDMIWLYSPSVTLKNDRFCEKA